MTRRDWNQVFGSAALEGVPGLYGAVRNNCPDTRSVPSFHSPRFVIASRQLLIRGQDSAQKPSQHLRKHPARQIGPSPTLEFNHQAWPTSIANLAHPDKS